MNGIDEAYDIRSIDMLLNEARTLSERCRHGLSDDRMAEAFEEALSIMLELRIPRMHETDEEWVDMLRDAMDGPTASSEEVFTNLSVHSGLFEEALKRYRAAVKNHEWMQAVSMLLVTGDGRLISWNGHDMALADDGTRCIASVTGPDGAEAVHSASATSEEGAALAMLLDLHRLEERIWKR
jgi:hypothetical protein